MLGTSFFEASARTEEWYATPLPSGMLSLLTRSLWAVHHTGRPVINHTTSRHSYKDKEDRGIKIRR